MSYGINRGRLRSVIDFLDRDIGYRYTMVKELLTCETEKQALEARQAQMDKRVELLFAFGGEQIEKRDFLQGAMLQLAEKREACLAELPDFEGEYREYLYTADFLAGQADRILDLENGDLLTTEEKPKKLCPELVKWDDKGADKAFQVKALLLQTFLRSCPPEVERRAMTAVVEYLECVDLSCYAYEEKNAFLAVVPYLILKGILQRVRAGRQEFAGEDRRHMEEALAKVPLGMSPYPILISYQNISRAGFMEREELLLLGYFYEYFSGERFDGTQFVQVWQTCFRKALHNRKYHHLMKDFLREGFGTFLRFFDAEGKRCLRDVFGEQKGQDEAVLQEYLSFFADGVKDFLEERTYLQEAAYALLRQSETGKLPAFRKLDMNYIWEDGRDGWLELSARCIAEIKEDWTDKNLNPAFWDSGWISRKIGEMCREQSKAGGGKRRESFLEKVTIWILPILGILMGTGKIGCYAGVAVLVCILLGSVASEKTRRCLLASYALYLITAVGGYMLGHETTLFYFIWAWSRPAVGVGKKIMILAAAVIVPMFLYVFVQGQVKKLREEGEQHERRS